MYNKIKMDKEQLRMQMLAGIITESQYKAILNENEQFESDFPSLDYNTIMNFITDNGFKITSEYYDGGFDVNDGEYFVGVFDDHIAVSDTTGVIKDIYFDEK